MSRRNALNDYQRGYLDCLCEVINLGCKKVSNSLDDVLPTDRRTTRKKLVREVRDVAAEHGIRLFVEEYNDRCDVNSGIIRLVRPDGSFREFGPGEHTFPNYSLLLYKNSEDLQRYLELMKRKCIDNNWDRAMGELYGYGEAEIEQFVREHGTRRKK